MSYLKQRITPSLLISSLALFVALGGASYAALGKNSVGSKQLKNNAVVTKKIKKNAVVTSKIKNNAVNGAKVNESSLGPVPSATIADTANLATIADTANLATRAGQLDGYRTFPQTRIVATAGATEAAARTAAPENVMFTAGPTTIYSKCFTDTSATRTYAEIFIKTSQDGVAFDSDNDEADGGPFLNISTLEINRQLLGQDAGLNQSEIDADSSYGTNVFTPDGLSYEMQPALAVKNGTLLGGNGLYGAGDACIVSGTLAERNG